MIQNKQTILKSRHLWIFNWVNQAPSQRNFLMRNNTFLLCSQIQVCSISFPDAWWSGMVLGLPKGPFIWGRKRKKRRETNECQACIQKGKLRSVHDRDSLEKAMPIQMRHEISFHVVHDPALFALVHREGLQRLPVVIKFCQDHRVVAGNQRTGGVAIILQHTQNHYYFIVIIIQYVIFCLFWKMKYLLVYLQFN